MEAVVNNDLTSYYRDKKVFVTGHTGFKGSWFITWLQELGANVKGYALSPEEDHGLYNMLSPFLTLESQFADIRDIETLKNSVMEFQPDFIFHMAAQALVRRSYEIPAQTFEVNTTGTANLLEAVTGLKKKCTVIIITTDKVYENRETGHHYAEEDILGGHDPYSASKAAAEIVVDSFRNSFFHPSAYSRHEKAVASVRAGNVIGGGDRSQDRIIPDIIRSLSSGIPVNVRNPGAVRPWQHVLEPLSGYLLTGMLLDQDAGKYSGAYNFGPLPGDHLPVKDLVQEAIDCWGAGSWTDTSVPDAPHEAGLLQLSIRKAQEVLHWHPRLQSHEAIKWTIDWYKQDPSNGYEYTISQIRKYQQLP